MLIHWNMGDVGLERVEHDHRRDIAWALSEHNVAGVDEEFRDELESMLGSGGDDNVVNARADTLQRHHLEDLLTQRGDALPGTVLQGLRTLRCHHPLESTRDECRRQPGHERHSPGERDNFGARGYSEQRAHL